MSAAYIQVHCRLDFIMEQTLWTGCPLLVWNEIPWLFTDFSLTKIHFSLTILPRFRARLLHLQPPDTPAFYKYWHKSN